VWPEAGLEGQVEGPGPWARQALLRLGYREPDLREAVRRFQQDARLVPDGLLGPRTQMALFALSPGTRARLSGGSP
jgi:peptidoglycan hydrolase-like protein with peptidoglycan-binding domain